MPTFNLVRNAGLLCALACAAASCAVNRPEEVNGAYREILDRRHNHYTLKAGDTVTIKLYNRPGDLNQTEVLVLPDGRSDLFFMDNHALVGKTLVDVEAELKARISGEVRDPEVSIQVKPKDDVCYFVGQFERPGSITLTTKMTLHEAVALAGGTKITGDTDWCLLRRPYRDPRHPDLYRIDLNDEVEEIFLLPGDQIVLNRTFFASVINYLREYIFGVLPSTAVSPTSYMGASAAGFAAF